MRKIQARIHSLDGQFDEVTIISEKAITTLSSITTVFVAQQSTTSLRVATT